MYLRRRSSPSFPTAPTARRCSKRSPTCRGRCSSTAGCIIPAQSRYDILAAQPYVRLVTRGNLTEIHADGVELSREDPFALRAALRRVPMPRARSALPFCGGAIGYFGYDLARRIEQLPARAQRRRAHSRHGDRHLRLGRRRRSRASGARGSSGRGAIPRPTSGGTRWCGFSASRRDERARAPFRIASPVTSNLTREAYARAFRSHQALHRRRRLLPGQSRAALQRAGRGRSVARVPGAARHQPGAFRGLSRARRTRSVLSASPERFLKVESGRVETKPIKGTRPRAGHAAPRRGARGGAAHERERPRRERDDRRPPAQRSFEELPARLGEGAEALRRRELRDGAPPREHGDRRAARPTATRSISCAARFPGGSITGAPKLRAMQIIEELEPHRRGVYCGAIGYIGFDGDMDLNIAIRTLVMSRGEIRFWAGGGIVADSHARRRIPGDVRQGGGDAEAPAAGVVERRGVRRRALRLDV